MGAVRPTEAEPRSHRRGVLATVMGRMPVPKGGSPLKRNDATNGVDPRVCATNRLPFIASPLAASRTIRRLGRAWVAVRSGLRLRAVGGSAQPTTSHPL
jgi:hypothetical protein